MQNFNFCAVETPCDNTVMYGFQLLTAITNSSIFSVGRGPGSPSSKVRFFKHLRFKKLLFAK